MNYKMTFQLLSLVVTSLTFLLSCKTSSPDLSRGITQFAKRQAMQEHGAFYEDSMMIERGNLDKSQMRYFVIVYTLEGIEGGNGYQQRLAIFSSESVGLNPIDYIKVSEKIKGSFDKLEIIDKEIVLTGKMVGPEDAYCCPSIPIRAHYKFERNRLVFVKGTKLVQ